jgi:hypothetical protein
MTTVRCHVETRIDADESRWHVATFQYRTTNTKRALATAMRAIQKRWPDAHRYEADIVPNTGVHHA